MSNQNYYNQPNQGMPDPMMMQGMGMGYAPPMALPSEKADLLGKINPNKIVEEVFHRLLGEVNINGSWKKEMRLDSRALSFKGAWDIATLMLPVSSQNVSLSKLKDSEIKARALSIARTAQIMCLRNWQEYNIKGVDQLWFVHEIVFSNSLVSLKQPLDEGIRKLLAGTITAEIAPQMSMEEQKGGFLASLFRKR